MGREAFRVLAFISTFAVVSSIIRLTADAFAREKREGTLGLLLLTPLKSHELLLGKLVSSTLGACYRFLAVVPVLALPILAGGVTFGEFALLVLALSNLAIFTAACGLYVSARCWNEGRAVSIASSVLAVVTILPPLLGAACRWAPGSALYCMSPGYAIWRVAITGAAQPPGFWWSVLLTHAGAWGFFLITCRLLPNSQREQAVVTAPLPQAAWSRRNNLPRQFEAAAQEELPEDPETDASASTEPPAIQAEGTGRARLIGANPMVWFALRQRAESLLPLLVGAPIVGITLMLVTGNASAIMTPAFVICACYILNAGVKRYVANQAARAFAGDSPNPSLELLLSTPLTPAELVHGHAAALRTRVREPILIMLVLETGWLAFSLLTAASGFRETMVWAFLGFVVLLLLIPDLLAVGWAGLWEGAVSKNAETAAGNAKLKVLGLPWLLVAAPMLLGAVFKRETTLVLAVLALASGSIVADRWFSRQARRKLQTELVQRARSRACGEVGYYAAWESLGRRLGRFWGNIRN